MIAKKNSRFDLERKRTALFAMGLLAAGSFTLAAFTYSSPFSVEKEKMIHSAESINYQVQELDEEEPIVQEIDEPVIENDDPQQSDPTMDAQVSPDDNINSSDNTSDEFDAEVGLKDLAYEFGLDVPVFDDLEAEIFEWVDVEAQFNGGVPEMFKFIQKTVEYPEISISIGEQGTVAVSFVVEKDGSITNIYVEKGVSKSLDREAKRVVREFPNWVPAEINAKKVRTRVRLPIVFILE